MAAARWRSATPTHIGTIMMVSTGRTLGTFTITSVMARPKGVQQLMEAGRTITAMTSTRAICAG